MPLEFFMSIEEERTQNNNEHPYKDISNPKNTQTKPTSPFRNIIEKKKEEKKPKSIAKAHAITRKKKG